MEGLGKTHNIGTNTDELIAHLNQLLKVVNAAGHACKLAMPTRGFSNTLAGLGDSRIIPMRRRADALAEVSRSEKKSISIPSSAAIASRSSNGSGSSI